MRENKKCEWSNIFRALDKKHSTVAANKPQRNEHKSNFTFQGLMPEVVQKSGGIAHRGRQAHVAAAQAGSNIAPGKQKIHV